MKKLSRIAFVSFYFPPYADISGVRAYKFCKHLPKYDFEVTVLTVDKRYYGEKVTNEPEEKDVAFQVNKLPYLPLIKAKFFSSLLFPFYVLLFLWRNRKKYDMVFITGSPYHPFLLTPIIKKILNLYVSLDFRDSWSHNYGFDGGGEEQLGLIKKIKHKIYYSIEIISIKYADFVTFSTPVLKEEYDALVPAEKDKFHVVFNGFDKQDFDDISPVSLTDKRSIILAGKFYLYTPDAVSTFIQVVKDYENLVFIYVGGESEFIRTIAHSLNASDSVVVLGYRPYKEVLELIAGSDCCLLSTGLVNGLGTKIFDYLALAKPTLCLVPPGSVIQNQFEGADGIYFVEYPHNHAAIKKCLDGILASGPNVDVGSLLNGYSRQETTEMLVKLIEKYGARE